MNYRGIPEQARKVRIPTRYAPGPQPYRVMRNLAIREAERKGKEGRRAAIVRRVEQPAEAE